MRAAGNAEARRKTPRSKRERMRRHAVAASVLLHRAALYLARDAETVVIVDPHGGRTDWCRELCSSWSRAEWLRFCRETGTPRGAHPAFGLTASPQSSPADLSRHQR